MAIILLGVVINLMLLPLYRRADAIQEEERKKEKQMEHWVKHIKKHFSGNERFMMLQTYYRQNNYKPYYSLKGMLPLVLEIPFFIAAYNYLSGLGDLHTSFSIISDMSRPDGLLVIGGTTINILPIAMTVINIISGAVYTRGLHLRDKLQLYGMAAVFLVLLYDSPSGLVLYWTVNNLFSLVKNLLVTFRNHRARNIILSSIGLIMIAAGLIMPKARFEDCIPLLDMGLILQIPPVLSLAKARFSGKPSVFKEHHPSYKLFFAGCLLMTIVTGVLNPSAVIASSPLEFVFFADYKDPLIHVLDSFLLAAGLFLVWFGIFYYLSGKRLKWILNILIWVISCSSVINSVFFGSGLGIMSEELKYENSISYSHVEILIDLAVLVGAFLMMYLFWKKSKTLVKSVYVILSVSVVGLSTVNIVKVRAAEPMIQTSIENVNRTNTALEQNNGNLLTLSKNKQNVIVIMLDRAAASLMPFMLQEMPRLKEMFDGFTFYSNTVSFGRCTNFASPSLYGGYEYTPSEINARPDVSLKEKQNEALRLMPLLFDDNGFDVTVLEPTYANYSWVPDLSIFDDRENIKAYNTEQGQFNTEYLSEETKELDSTWTRNFFCYGLMRSAPCLLQDFFYQNGNYYRSESQSDSEKGTVEISRLFMNCYSVLEALPDVCTAKDTQKGSFIMMSNSTPHEPQILKEPEYVPDPNADNSEYDNSHSDRFIYNGKKYDIENSGHFNTYHVNMATLLRLGEWFTQMRKEGVYDNTRIIIVADHGAPLGIFDELIIDDSYDITYFNPLLMVKDFNAKGFSTDGSFMTQADVPTLAFDGIIEDPVNPSTGKPVNNDAKKGEQKIFFSEKSAITTNNGNVFEKGIWYSVHDDIFDVNNWKYIGSG